MKKSLAVLMSVLFLASAGMALADATSPATKVVKHPQHHKKGPKKPKNTLNPQPLPPSKLPPAQGGSKPQ